MSRGSCVEKAYAAASSVVCCASPLRVTPAQDTHSTFHTTTSPSRVPTTTSRSSSVSVMQVPSMSL